MNKLLFAMTAVGALAAAAPAAAQYGSSYQSNGYNSYNQKQNDRGQYNQGQYNQNQYDRGQYNNGYTANSSGQTNVDSGVARLDARIQAGIDNGTIDQREAWNLRRQLSDITRLDDRYSRDGYTASERADMQRRLRAFRDQLASADGGARGYGRYGTNGANNGYSANGYYGQGGPFEEVTCTDTRRGGLGGLIDGLFGNDDRDCSTTANGYGGTGYGSMLGVGARVSGDLGGVPYEYRNQYRDGYGYYYRSDGRAIYQIDTRTNTVLRAYPMNR
jgi:hypothetical protein